MARATAIAGLKVAKSKALGGCSNCMKWDEMV
jgi:hypothetical protein